MQANKLAIITGASRGIGRAIAINFASLGYDVVLIATKQGLLQQLAQEIQSKYAVNALVYCISVADAVAVQNMVLDLQQHYTKIDILFNNAGVLTIGTLEVGAAEFAQVLATNLIGSYNLIQAVAPLMQTAGAGYIFNVASRSGKVAIPKFGVYAASKFGLLGLNAALYAEMMPYNVKVTALCPSVVNTDMAKDFNIADSDKIQIPDLVNTVNYLLSLGSTACIKEIDIDCKYVLLEPYQASR